MGNRRSPFVLFAFFGDRNERSLIQEAERLLEKSIKVCPQFLDSHTSLIELCGNGSKILLAKGS